MTTITIMARKDRRPWVKVGDRWTRPATVDLVAIPDHASWPPLAWHLLAGRITWALHLVHRDGHEERWTTPIPLRYTRHDLVTVFAAEWTAQ